MMFYLLENKQMGDRNLLNKGVRDIASKGFDSIMLQVRDTAFQLDDPEVIESVRLVVREAHRLGLTVTLAFITTNCRSWWFSFFKKHPKSGEIIVKKAEGEIKNGKLKAVLTFPGNAMPVIGHFEGIFAVFTVRDKVYTLLPNFKWTCHVERKSGIDDGGEWFCLSEIELQIEGDIPGIRDSSIVLYGAFHIMNPDYVSKEFAYFMDYLLEKYKGIRLDGIAWDEPAGGIIGPNYYRLSKDVCATFYKEHGYDIKEKAYALDYSAPESTKVRYDYFNTIIKVLYHAQAHFIKKGRELFGKDIFSGIHHTWVGESTILDLWAGCIDYFLLSENLSGGITDCAFSDEKSVIYTYRLAKSIGKYHQNNLAYSNCWCFCPTREKLVYFTGLMAIWNIYWIAHAYGHALGGFGPGYPYNKTWDDMADCTRRINRVSEFLGGAKEVIKIAVYHSWESVARINSLLGMVYKTTQLNLAYELVQHNLQFDFIGKKQLAESNPQKEKLVISNNNYEILIIPWPNLLPDEVWSKVRQYIHSGGRVIFIGPPALETTAKKNISKEFFEIIKIKSFSMKEYIGRFYGSHPMPHDRISQSKWFYPLKPLQSQPVVGDEYGVAGVRMGHVYYLSAIDPAWCIVKIINNCGYKRDIDCKIPNLLYNIFKNDGAHFICAIGRYSQSFSGRIDFVSGFLEIEKADLLCAKIKDNKIILLGEKMGKIKSNLKIISQKDIHG